MAVREPERAEVAAGEAVARRPKKWMPPAKLPVPLSAALWAAAIAILSSPYIDSRRPINWLDDSWPVGLLMAARQGVHWGTDFLFTYGPYGVLALDRLYFLPEALVALAAALAIHAAFIGLLAARMAALKVRLFVWLVATGVLLLRGPMLSFGYEAQFVMVLLLGIALDPKRIGNRRSVLAAVVAAFLGALLCLWKSSDGVAALGMIAVASGFTIARGRPAMAGLMAAVVGVGLVGLWLFAGQQLDGALPYLRGVYEFASGYGPAVALSNFSLEPAIGAALAALLIAVTYRAWRRRDEAFVFLLLSLPVLVIAFRVNFTRADIEHEVIYLYVVILVVLLAAVTLSRPSIVARVLLAALVPAALLGISGGPLSQISVMDQRIGTYQDLYALSRGGGEPLREVARRYYSLSDDQRAVLRSGSVDGMPWDLLLPYGYHLIWQPRPVLQSYAAYTSYLDRLDAAHFLTGGPDHIVFRYEEIDNRYPPFDEPATLRALMLNYEADPSSDARYMVLDKRAVALEKSRREEGHVCGVMGDAIDVPRAAGRPLFAAVHVSYSTLGRVSSALYAPPPVFVELAYSGDQHVGPFRLVPGVAVDGLLMSSYVADNNDMESLFRGDLTNSIDSFTVTTQFPFAYDAQICADFFSLTAG